MIHAHGASGNQDLREDHSLSVRLYDEIFDTTLPSEYQKGEWSLRFQPKLSDFRDDDYVRFLVGTRYSFSDYFDAHFDLGTYFANPFQDGTGVGVYAVRLGSRYTWLKYPGRQNNLATGINVEIPIDDPPEELTDGYARYQPFITVSHRIKDNRHWLLYLNFTHEFVENTPGRTAPTTPQPMDRVFLRPGTIYYPGGNLRYSLELEYRTNALHFRSKEPLPPDYSGPPPGVRRPQNYILAYEEVHEVIAKPGLTWFPATEVREGLWLPGDWDIGIYLDIPIIEETGEDIGISVRFRWSHDYRKQLLRRLPDFLQNNDTP